MNTANEHVVLVHGLWLRRWYLLPLAWQLQRCGYTVHRFDYPSARASLSQDAERLNAFGAAIDGETVHWVGHSMGGLVIRALFTYFPDQRPGRVVTLGTPHGGSAAARRVTSTVAGRVLMGPGASELVDGLPQTWPAPERDFGVVAGSRSLGLGRLVLRHPQGPGDGTVLVAETRLSGMTDHLVLPVCHSGMLLSPAVARAACTFLARGRFDAVGEDRGPMVN
jgi:pimeloyl-ACP methyl ester carboxylesterase